MMTAGQRAQVMQAQKRLGLQGMSTRGRAMAEEAARGQGGNYGRAMGAPGPGTRGNDPPYGTVPPEGTGPGGGFFPGGTRWNRGTPDRTHPSDGPPGAAPRPPAGNPQYPAPAGTIPNPNNSGIGSSRDQYPYAKQYTDSYGQNQVIPVDSTGKPRFTPPPSEGEDRSKRHVDTAEDRQARGNRYADMARYMPNAPASLIRQLQKAGYDTTAQDISGASEHIQQGFGEREGQKLWNNAVGKSLGEKRGGPTAGGGISWNDPNVPGFEHGDPSGYWQQKAIENQKAWAAGGGNKPRPPGEGPNAWGPSEVPPGMYPGPGGQLPAPEQTQAQAPAAAPQQDPNFAGNPEAPTEAPSNYQTQEQATMYNGVAGQPPDYNQFVQQLQNAMSGQGGPQGQQFMQQIMSQLQGMGMGGGGYYQPYGAMGNYGMGSPYQMGGYGYF